MGKLQDSGIQARKFKASQCKNPCYQQAPNQHTWSIWSNVQWAIIKQRSCRQHWYCIREKLSWRFFTEMVHHTVVVICSLLLITSTKVGSCCELYPEKNIYMKYVEVDCPQANNGQSRYGCLKRSMAPVLPAWLPFKVEEGNNENMTDCWRGLIVQCFTSAP